VGFPTFPRPASPRAVGKDHRRRRRDGGRSPASDEPSERKWWEMRVFNGVDELREAKGSEVGASDWVEVGQEQIDGFADATGDHQWIHVDAERAKDGPFGTTIAHGFLTLSLLPKLVQGVYRIEGVKMGVNYGLNKVRFTSPLPVGSRVRGRVEIIDVTDISGGVQIASKVTVEIENSEKPAVVAEWLTRQYV
jgi:acyl dehydratase